MSAISGYLSTILNAVYGEQVRTAIINAITQCYSDVTNPSLNTEAFSTAIEAAYADGFLDIQEKSTIAGMTNQNIIYRYTGNEAGYVNGALYYYDGTKWAPIGSALQIASSSALMTDQGAIYKYTGSESGYINGALYYYDGTSFVPLMDKDSTDTAILNSRNNMLQTLTEAESGAGTNLLNPDNIKKLGYHYDTSDGETEVSDTTYYVSEEMIDVGNNGVAFYLLKDTTSSYYNLGVLCYDKDGDFLGNVSTVATSNHNLIVLKKDTEFINIQYTGSVLPSQLCLTDEPTDTFKPYSMDISERVIKTSLLDTSALSAEFLEKVASGDNLIDPANLTAWGWSLDNYNGAVYNDTTGDRQITKEPIQADGALEVYIRAKTAASQSYHEARVFCFGVNDTYLGGIAKSLNTTASQKVTLANGTIYFYVGINTFETTFPSANLCVSFEELDAFQDFAYTLRIKSELLGNEAAAKNSKRSTLYKKNAIIFGDSLIDQHTALVEGIRSMTGLLTIYNAAIAGTSMSIRADSGIYAKWWTMVNIADCIASGEWDDTISAVSSDSQVLAKANYLKDVDFDDIDLIIIAHGANDSATDSDTAPYDTSTYGGAIRHIIDVITTAYPHIKIVFCSVIYRTNGVEGCKQKLDILKGACNDFFVQYIDNLTELGINAYNASYYLSDGLHESAAGEKLILDHIVQCIW